MMPTPVNAQVQRELLLMACRCALDSSGSRQLRESLHREPDLDSWLLECHLHGILPSAYQAVNQALGGEHRVTETLRQSFLGQSLQVFQWAPELLRVTGTLHQAGIDTLAIKGMAMAHQVYGGIVQRPAGDLDVLVAPKQAWRATEILTSLGYEPMGPGALEVDQERALIRFGEGRQFQHRVHGYLVDLNWRTLDRGIDVRLPFEELWERREVLDFSGGRLATLSLEDCALLLCLHGTQHGFHRLKWVLDVARVASIPKVSWQQVRLSAGHREPMIGYALALAHCLMSSPLPEECEPVPEVWGLVRKAESRLRCHPPAQPSAVSYLDPHISTTLIPILSNRSSLQRWVGWVRAFACPAREDVSSVSLPYPLSFFYYLVRLVHLVKKGWSRSRALVGRA